MKKIRIRKANKRHLCVKCKSFIIKGELYGSWITYGGNMAYHLRCSEDEIVAAKYEGQTIVGSKLRDDS